jgi:hypothetical protein
MTRAAAIALILILVVLAGVIWMSRDKFPQLLPPGSPIVIPSGSTVDSPVLPPPPPPPVSTPVLPPPEPSAQTADSENSEQLSAGTQDSTPHDAPAVDQADVEAQRIEERLRRIQSNPQEREAFYDEMSGTIERIRQSERSQEDAAGEAADSPKTDQSPTVRDDRVKSPPPQPVRPSSGPLGNSARSLKPIARTLDRGTFSRVLYWAKVNHAPVALTLAVAWQESRLQPYPPRGVAGEVGTFQILPERCRVEGWAPRRLHEPDFNAWLGTYLIAKYYQEERSYARAAAKFVAGPGVFRKRYPVKVRTYINWYARSVEDYARHFYRYYSS